MEQLEARQAHNLKAGGSSPPPATQSRPEASSGLVKTVRTLRIASHFRNTARQLWQSDGEAWS